MTSSLRLLLLRLLLLSVFFTGAVGVPLHEARHLREIAQVAASLAAVDDATGRQSRTPFEEVDARCAWCHAFCDPALASPPGATVPPEPPSPKVPACRSTRFVAFAGHWRYAARDPPRTPA